MEKTEQAQLKALLGALIETSPDREKPQGEESSKRIESFEPFSWTPHIKHPSIEINLISHTHDIAAGLELVLELIEDCWLIRDNEDNVPLLHEGQQSKLLRLAISSSALLSERSMEILSWKEDAARKKTENS